MTLKSPGKATPAGSSTPGPTSRKLLPSGRSSTSSARHVPPAPYVVIAMPACAAIRAPAGSPEFTTPRRDRAGVNRLALAAS